MDLALRCLLSTPLDTAGVTRKTDCWTIQGYLAHVKTPTIPGPPWDTRHRPTVGSQVDALSCFL